MGTDRMMMRYHYATEAPTLENAMQFDPTIIQHAIVTTFGPLLASIVIQRMLEW